jgi:OFA family oxalate/formate antiporter-like MFS transporter
VGAVVSGVGAGAVYATSVGSAVKWFPDRRGLAVGLTAAGFGAGAAATVIPIREVIAASGYQAAFFWFGLVQGAIVVILAWFLRSPAPGEVPVTTQPKIVQSSESYSPSQVLVTPVFWVLYIMFVLVSASGLMATAQIALIAKDYNLADTIVAFGATTLTVALLVDNIANGAARPLFGWISDHIGRENTMAIVFSCGALGYWALGTIGNTPWVFIVTAGLVYFTWGEIYSLFPATCTDSFGPKYATTNAGLLYTAKGTASFLVPFASLFKSYAGSWQSVFVVAMAANLLVAACAFFVLKPMRARHNAGLLGRPQIRVAE